MAKWNARLSWYSIAPVWRGGGRGWNRRFLSAALFIHGLQPCSQIISSCLFVHFLLQNMAVYSIVPSTPVCTTSTTNTCFPPHSFKWHYKINWRSKQVLYITKYFDTWQTWLRWMEKYLLALTLFVWNSTALSSHCTWSICCDLWPNIGFSTWSQIHIWKHIHCIWIILNDAFYSVL